MSCCAPGAEAVAEDVTAPEHDDETLMAASRTLKDGTCQLELAVPDIHCAACIATIEKELGKLDNVASARVNFSTRRAQRQLRAGQGAALGHRARHRTGRLSRLPARSGRRFKARPHPDHA